MPSAVALRRNSVSSWEERALAEAFVCTREEEALQNPCHRHAGTLQWRCPHSGTHMRGSWPASGRLSRGLPDHGAVFLSVAVLATQAGETARLLLLAVRLHKTLLPLSPPNRV